MKHNPRLFSLICLCLFGALGSHLHSASLQPGSPLFSLGAELSTDPAKVPHPESNYGRLPLAFEALEGHFLARGRGYKILLSPQQADLVLLQPAQKADKKNNLDQRPPSLPRQNFLRLELVGANSAASAQGLDMLPGHSNYFIGNDPLKWKTNIAQYAKVEFKEVYPGVDLVYYGNQGKLEYDFVLKAGADLGAIAWKVTGAKNMAVDLAGDLLITVEGGQLLFAKPACFELINGLRKVIEGRYVLAGKERIKFEIKGHIGKGILVIDPTLSYSTYIGGSGSDDSFVWSNLALDNNGNAYVTGRSTGNFPVTGGSFQTTYGGGSYDAMVSKINSTGDTLIFSTYLGGSGIDQGLNLAVDANNDVYVTGYTAGGFPVTAGASQTTFGGGPYDAFVTKLNAGGSALIYSSYLGGTGDDRGEAIALDSSKNAYVRGNTTGNFPTTLGAYQTVYGGGSTDYFVTKLNSSGNTSVYSTYLGGNGEEEWGLGNGVAVDNSGNAYVTGWTTSKNFPTTAGVIQTIYGGGDFDVVVVKLNSAGNGLVYSTYLGGNDFDSGHSIALDIAGNVYVAGETDSVDFPTTVGAYKTTIGDRDGFVTKLNNSGTALLYSTFVGGPLHDYVDTIYVDGGGNAYLAGGTSGGFPTTAGAYQTTFGGGSYDAIVSKLNSSGSALIYSTYFGGSSGDWGRGIGVDSSGNIYLAGYTHGSLPVTAGAYQTTYGGGSYDLFVAKFGADTPTITPTFTMTPTFSATGTPTGTPTATQTRTPTRTPTLTRTATGTRTATPTFTGTRTFTTTRSATPTRTDSPSPSTTVTDSPTKTLTPTFSNSPTATPTGTITPTFSNSPTKTISPTITATFTAVRDLQLTLYPASPNPFGTDGTYFTYWVQVDSTVSIKIYTISGEVVRDLLPYEAKAGNNKEFWDGKNWAGAVVASGTYFYRVEAVSKRDEHQAALGRVAALW